MITEFFKFYMGIHEEDLEALWGVLNGVLESGQKKSGYSILQFTMKYIFLEGLLNASVPVFLTKYQNGNGSEAAQPMIKGRADKAWGTILMAHNCGHSDLAKECFYKAIREQYYYAIEMTLQLAHDKDHAVLLTDHLL